MKRRTGAIMPKNPLEPAMLTRPSLNDSVAVCIPTFRRPQGLRNLLESLNRLTFSRVAVPSLRIIICDNDPERPVISMHPDFRSWSIHPVTYAIEPQPGVAHVRNRLLDMAPPECGLLAFVDDDEVVCPHWLDALMDVRQRFSADVVFGPVEAAYEETPPAWMRRGRFHELGPFQDGTRFEYAISGNSLALHESIRHLRFDERLSTSGGEDQEFFSRLHAAGGVIVTSEDAVIVETVPAARMRLGWLLKRHFRTGTTLARIDRAAGRTLQRILKSLARMGAGGLHVLASPFRGMDHCVSGLIQMARGAGGILGLFGARVRIYR